MDKTYIKLAAVGDIAMIQQPNKELWKGIWETADIRLANLEAPIVGTPGPPAEKLIRMKQPLETGEWLKELKVTAVSLANNHMLDWGIEGLKQTIDSLDEVGITHTGAGFNLEEASEPLYLTLKGYTIAFLSWSSTVPAGYRALPNRPGIASVRIRTSFETDSSILDEQPGTPPYIKTEPIAEDLHLLEKAIESAKAQADFVILAIHWGVPPQWSSHPQGLLAEYQKAVADRVTKCGVDLIIGHHSHAPYGMGEYQVGSQGVSRTVPVLYSLGNYIFHPEFIENGFDRSPFHIPYSPTFLEANYQSCMVEINLKSDTTTKRLYLENLVIYPAMLDKIGEAREASQEESRRILNRLYEFSKAQGARISLEENRLVWKGV